MTTKTYYYIKYITWGMDKPAYLWYRDRSTAYEVYYDSDFCDRPKAVTYRKAESITNIERIIDEQGDRRPLQRQYQ